MAIDRADWHWESAEKLYRETNGITGELTETQENDIWLLAANHIGLFLRWVIENGFEGEGADEQACEMVREGRMTGAQYLMRYCDGKLWDEDIRSDILSFVTKYYDEQFFDDYGLSCGNEDEELPCYSFISGDDDYMRLRQRIDAAYEKFIGGEPDGQA